MYVFRGLSMYDFKQFKQWIFKQEYIDLKDKNCPCMFEF